jgi:putative transposase
VTGRKRHVVVDTLGLIVALVVHSAAVQDRDGAYAVLAKVLVGFPRLRVIWADGGYAGRLVRSLGRWKRSLGWVLQIAKRTDDVKGFVVQPKRWIVERTFGWLTRYRRLNRDYETLPVSSETLVYLAMISLMVRRLEPK